jgi:hypothetical protein
MVEMGATVKNFSAPMKEIEALVRAGRFHHDGDPVLAWMISNVVATSTRRTTSSRTSRREEQDRRRRRAHHGQISLPWTLIGVGAVLVLKASWPTLSRPERRNHGNSRSRRASVLLRLGHPGDANLMSYFGGGRSIAGASVTPDSAMTVMAIYRAVRLISRIRWRRCRFASYERSTTARRSRRRSIRSLTSSRDARTGGRRRSASSR